MQLLEEEIIDLKDRTIRGMSTLIAREAGMKILAVIAQFILIRILAPEFFGIFAILTFIISTAELFTDVGFNHAIIQKKKSLTQYELSTIFYVRTILSWVVFLVVFFSAPFIITLFHTLNSNAVVMLQILALVIIIKPYESIITSLLERDLSYHLISIIDLVGILLYYISAILFALLGFQVWSFIYAVVVKEFFELCMSFYIKKWIPLFSFKPNSIKKIVNYGSYLQIGAVFTHINLSSIPLLGGILTGTQSVGYLVFSANVSSIPNVLIDNFGRIAFASFSRIQHDLKLISHASERSITLLNILIFLFIAGMICFSSDFIRYFLTQRWLPALPALYWIVASTYFYGGTVTMGHALMAIGKSKEMLYISILPIILQWVIPLVLIPYIGFTAVAIGIFANTAVMFVSYIFLLRRHKISVNYSNAYLRVTGILIGVLLFAFWLNSAVPNSLFTFFVKVVATSALYFLLCWALLKKEFTQIIQMGFTALKIRND